MSLIWILLTLFYGLTKGARELVKKKALEKSSVPCVLFLYSLLGLIFLLPDAAFSLTGTIWGLGPMQYALVAVKSFMIFIAWICSFRAIKKIPISVYSLLDLSRVIFATLLGVIVLHEVMGLNQIFGLMLVALGLLFLRFGKKKAAEETGAVYVFMALVSCLLNALSGLMDKILTNTEAPYYVSSMQLQFWYMLFLTIFYGLYLAFSKEKHGLKAALKNHWIWLLSIMFILADRALFIANEIPDSKVTVMTLIKQSGCLVSIVGGRLFFKEKNIGFKLICAGVIIAGIVIGVM